MKIVLALLHFVRRAHRRNHALRANQFPDVRPLFSPWLLL